MWTTIPQSASSTWSSEHWYVATLPLTREIGSGSASVAPARWLYLLWKPSVRAIPYREPDVISVTHGDPWPLIREACDQAPVYELKDNECDWPSWLDMLLHLPQDDEWTAALLRKAKTEAQQSMRMRWIVTYRLASDEYPADGDQHVPDFGDFGRHGVERITAADLPAHIEIDESRFNPVCSCIEYGRFDAGLVSDGYLDSGWKSNTWSVACLHRCASCRRIWLRLFHHNADAAGDNSWCMGRISGEMAKRITPELAADYLAALPWYWCGGKLYGARVIQRQGRPEKLT